MSGLPPGEAPEPAQPAADVPAFEDAPELKRSNAVYVPGDLPTPVRKFLIQQAMGKIPAHVTYEQTVTRGSSPHPELNENRGESPAPGA